MSNDKTLELQIRIAAEEAARIVAALKGDIKGLADEAGKFAKNDGAALKQSFKEAETAAKDTANSINGIKNSVGELAQAAIALKALSFIKDMGEFALQTADNFQTMKNQFGILLGDMEAGAGLFNEIKAFNDVTPFDLDTLNQATSVLIAAKVPLQDLQSQLTKFGDLSQGNSQRLTSYVHAFSQAAAKGKADMQVLNTYLNQGVPILDALAKNFGVTTAEIMKMSSDGQISFEEFSRALDDLTAAGGQYFGGMELASKSLSAMQEGLREATNTLAASYGELLMPAALGTVEALTKITNAINDSPIGKGIFAAAIVTLTGLLAGMAVKTWGAYAAQMALNLAKAAGNPILLASTLAVAGLAAGYTAMAANNQNAAREAENFALAQRKQADAINAAAAAMDSYTQQYKNMSEVNRAYTIRDASAVVTNYERELNRFKSRLEELNSIKITIGTEFYTGGIEGALAIEEEIKKIDAQIAEREGQLQIAQTILNSRMLALQKVQQDFIENEAVFGREWRNKLISESEAIEIERQEAINRLRQNARDTLGTGWERSTAYQEEVNALSIFFNRKQAELTKASGEAAEKWKKSWDETWNQFQADQAGDPFYKIELERRRTLEDAHANYIRTLNQATLDQVNEYYDAQRREITDRLDEAEAQKLKELAEEEGRIQRELTRSRIDDIQYEYEEMLRAINELEERRVLAAADSEEEIARIRDQYAQMREDADMYFRVEIDTAKLEEAREAVKSWQEELSDSLLNTLIDLEVFSDRAAVILSELSAQLLNLSANAALSGFEEFGRALGEGENAAESMTRALSLMAQQILKQLPMMFLQAGLQLIANGQWPLGLGFIAAAGSSAIISGYVDGTSKHAHGGVFDEYGKAAKAFASGGAFTNQIVSSPTYFAHGAGFGLMGEAGPEAIMPLTQMPDGNLGVQTMGTGSRAYVNVVIHNHSGAEVRQEKTENADGSTDYEIIIGEAVNKLIASGKTDRTLGGRFGLRPAGV